MKYSAPLNIHDSASSQSSSRVRPWYWNHTAGTASRMAITNGIVRAADRRHRRDEQE